MELVEQAELLVNAACKMPGFAISSNIFSQSPLKTRRGCEKNVDLLQPIHSFSQR